MAELLRRRLPLTVGLYLLLVGMAMVSEVVFHPERTDLVAAAYLAHMMISGLGLLAARPDVAGGRGWVPPMIMSCCYAVVLTIYPSVVHLGAQAIALGHVCLLSGLFVLLPWPWQAQCGVSVTVLGHVRYDGSGASRQ